MKKITLLLALLVASFTFAQTTHNYNWFVQQSVDIITIQEGDTVNWIWADSFPHSITSDSNSADTFDSGVLPAGSTFARVFPDAGTNGYFCQVHASMLGVIEVEASLGVEEDEYLAFNYYPNPVKEFLRVDSKELIISMQIHDINGRQLMDAPIQNKSANTYMGGFQKGIYFVTVNFEKSRKTIQVVLDK